MKIRTKFAVVTALILLLSVGVTVFLTVRAIQLKGEEDAAAFREEELRQVKQKLRNLVDIAYASIDANYATSTDKGYLEARYGDCLEDLVEVAESFLDEKARLVDAGVLSLEEAQRQALEALRQMRYDDGSGYIWVNDTTLPYPTMIMHPTVPELDGQVLDDAKFDCALGAGKNLFQAFAEICKERGEGFVDYLWPKPGPDGALIPDVPKLSYGRLFEPWGWILGTGVYVDDAVQDAIAKCKADVRAMRYDGGTGYFWINDCSRPYPAMIMHTTIPELDGQVLDDPEFNCALGEGRNLFAAFVDVCEDDGEGYVDYFWPKPLENGLTEPAPKLSYVREYEPLGWIVGTGVYVDGIDSMIRLQNEARQRLINRLVLWIVACSGGVFLAALVISFLAGNSITKPLRRLVDTMRLVEQEGLSEQRAEPSGSFEVRKLGEIFNRMLDAIEKAVAELTETTAAKERIESELSVARQIQMGLLPKIVPPFPDRDEFELAATMEPAKEVGGDFYDFFFTSPTRLCLAIGDVSGKGVPASLFMAITKTLLNAASSANQDPGRMLRQVNIQLSHDNENCMFVSVFCAILDFTTGQLYYANAGHNPPYIMRAQGGIDALEHKGAPVLGAFEEAQFGVDSVQLKPGDTLFLYTDGVPEAHDAQGVMFTDERLVQELETRQGRRAGEIIESMRRDIEAFYRGAPQFDDITMLAVTFHGSSKRRG